VHHYEFYLLLIMNSIKASPPKLQISKKHQKILVTFGVLELWWQE